METCTRLLWKIIVAIEQRSVLEHPLHPLVNGEELVWMDFCRNVAGAHNACVQLADYTFRSFPDIENISPHSLLLEVPAIKLIQCFISAAREQRADRMAIAHADLPANFPDGKLLALSRGALFRATVESNCMSEITMSYIEIVECLRFR